MFLTYGFSAKRTSGYGVAEDKISGLLKTTWGVEWPFKDITFADLVTRTKEGARV